MLKELGTGTGGILVCLILLIVPETHSWTVQHDDSVCMIMTFNASIEFNSDGIDASFIPLNALSDGSVCGQSFSILHLEYDLGDQHEVTLSFGFNKTESEWLMSEIIVELYNLKTSKGFVQITESGFEEFSTPLGHYLQCESRVMIDDVSLTFTEIETMQPFATSEDPGKEHDCEADQGYDDSNTGLIVGCVLAAMAVAVISCCVCSRMRKRRQSRRYRRSKNYVS
eukprot:XP_001199529.2 PREDICTED: uncharacterized protein LOC763522 [Strongylocentrotus purpuratus]